VRNNWRPNVNVIQSNLNMRVRAIDLVWETRRDAVEEELKTLLGVEQLDNKDPRCFQQRNAAAKLREEQLRGLLKINQSEETPTPDENGTEDHESQQAPKPNEPGHLPQEPLIAPSQSDDPPINIDPAMHAHNANQTAQQQMRTLILETRHQPPQKPTQPCKTHLLPYIIHQMTIQLWNRIIMPSRYLPPSAIPDSAPHLQPTCLYSCCLKHKLRIKERNSQRMIGLHLRPKKWYSQEQGTGASRGGVNDT